MKQYYIVRNLVKQIMSNLRLLVLTLYPHRKIYKFLVILLIWPKLGAMEMHILLRQPKTCASFTTIHEVGIIVQNPPTL